MKLNITCPCCNKSVQVILSDVDTGDVKVTGVFLNDDLDIENNQEELEKELFKNQNILLG
nr:MAG TPA: zinc-ribbon domain protein [Caudoviricetes sp.]